MMRVLLILLLVIWFHQLPDADAHDGPGGHRHQLPDKQNQINVRCWIVAKEIAGDRKIKECFVELYDIAIDVEKALSAALPPR